MSTLDYSAKFTEGTAVLGPAPCDHRLDVAFAKFRVMWFGVVAAIDGNDFGLLERPATYTANRRKGVDERQQLSNVVAVFARQDGTDGDAIVIDEDVVLGNGSRAIGGIRASFSPAPTARAGDESTAASERSSLPTSRNLREQMVS